MTWQNVFLYLNAELCEIRSLTDFLSHLTDTKILNRT
jgi:hypothetical protein